MITCRPRGDEKGTHNLYVTATIPVDANFPTSKSHAQLIPTGTKSFMHRLFEREFVVQDDMLDANGHLNNVVFVQWMQTVAVTHSDANGATMELYRKLGDTWYARSHHIEYHRPAFQGDRILARTWVAGIKRISSVRQYRFLDAANGELLVTAQTNWVYVDANTGRPKRIDPRVLSCFEIWNGDSQATSIVDE